MGTLPNKTTQIRQAVFPAIDKILFVSQSEIVIYYTHREPVTITGPDAMAVFEWLLTPNPPREDIVRVYRAGLETTMKAA